MIRLILISLAFLLFPLNYGISELAHPDDIDKWDLLRHGIYSWNILLAASITLFKVNKRHEPFVKLLCYGLVLGQIVPDLIDRYRNVYGFHWYDVAFIIAAVYGGSRYFFPKIHRIIGEAFLGKKLYNYFICLNQR